MTRDRRRDPSLTELQFQACTGRPRWTATGGSTGVCLFPRLSPLFSLARGPLRAPRRGGSVAAAAGPRRGRATHAPPRYRRSRSRVTPAGGWAGRPVTAVDSAWRRARCGCGWRSRPPPCPLCAIGPGPRLTPPTPPPPPRCPFAKRCCDGGAVGGAAAAGPEAHAWGPLPRRGGRRRRPRRPVPGGHPLRPPPHGA